MYLYLCANRSVVLPLGAQGCRLGKAFPVEMRYHRAPGELVPGAVLEEVRVEVLCSEPHVWNQKKVTKVIHLHWNKHGFTMKQMSALLTNSVAVLTQEVPQSQGKSVLGPRGVELTAKTCADPQGLMLGFMLC